MRRLAILSSVIATFAAAPLAHAAAIFQINGAGNGHGIGMSQYGAYGYALHGRDYRFILSHYYQGTGLGRVNPNQVVRVLISTGSASFSGASGAAAPGSSVKKLSPAATYSVRVLPNGRLALYTAAGKKVAGFAGTPLTVTGPGPLDLAGHGAYRGAFEFRSVAGAVQTVNALGVDDYVRGVVSAEMPSSWSPAALEAQAVAARTYALTSNVGGNGYQLYPDTRSQMYGGLAAETAATNAAVAATSGQIVTYNGAPATTYFFSSSGGYTENIENVWLGSSPEPWLRGVPDPYDGTAGNPYYRWSQRLSLAAASGQLGSLVSGSLRGIRITKHGVSPRVVDAEVVATGGKSSVSGPQLQQIFGLTSTYMRFTTISAAIAARPAVSAAALHRLRPNAISAVLRAKTWRLGGFVFPAPNGSTLTVERRVSNAWQAVRRVGVRAGGSYGVLLAAPGSYRVVFAGVAGPTVSTG